MTLNKKRIRKTLWKINLSFYNRAQIHIHMGRKSWKYFGDYNVNTSFVVVRRKCALFPNKNGKETNFPWYATNKPQRKPKRWYRMQCIIKINSLFPNAHKTCVEYSTPVRYVDDFASRWYAHFYCHPFRLRQHVPNTIITQ